MAENSKDGGMASLEGDVGKITQNLDIVRDFMGLIRKIESFPDMRECSYDETRSLYQAVSEDKDRR